jgi:hypothetical protein
MDNAKDTLTKAHKEDNHYDDKKYVRAVRVIAAGFDNAYKIIDRIRPDKIPYPIRN